MAIIQRRRRPNVLGESLGNLITGFQAGRQGRQEREVAAGTRAPRTLAEAKSLAEIQELERKTQGLDSPAPQDYFRDPYSGKLYPKDPYRGRGTTVNLPFSLNSGQQDQDADSSQVFDDPSQADTSGLPQGTVVMVINPATGQAEPYEI